MDDQDSEKGDLIEFETPASHIHKLMYEEDDIAIEDNGKVIGLRIKEIEPIEAGRLKVIAQIIWVESQT